MILAVILVGIVVFIQGIQIDLLTKGVDIMAHEKTYAVCDNMCLEETMTKEQIQTAINNASVKDGEITTSKLANGAVTKTKIADFAVKHEHIGAAEVDWDNMFPTAVALTGSYTGTGTEQTIDVGVNCWGNGLAPQAMTIICDDNYAIGQIIADSNATTNKKAYCVIHYYDDTEQKITSGAGDIVLTEHGIKLSGFSELNKQGNTYRYIAFR
nr:MAG TPA: hypothetical protein [Caudoviricetes sp.]